LTPTSGIREATINPAVNTEAIKEIQDMHPELKARFDAIETRRKALVDRVRALPSEKQKQQPADKGFTPLEIIMHFAIAESSNMEFLRKTPPASLKGKKVRYGIFYPMTLKGLQNPGKQMTAPPMFVPKGAFTLDEADQKWQAVRKEFAGYLEQAENPQDPWIKMFFIFGTLSAADYLEFTEAHLGYHEARFPA
jgi:hypothetical protein